MALLFLVEHFQIADRSLAARAPVHDVSATIDSTLLMQADEGLAHRNGQVLVHSEVFALPIDGGSEALHLIEDDAAVVLPPLPYTLDKGLAAKLLAARAFAG